MNHSEPKVTIDLKEYNELQDYKKRFFKSKVSDYQLAFSIMFKYGANILGPMVKQDLDKHNLILIVSADVGSEYRSIFVEKIK